MSSRGWYLIWTHRFYLVLPIMRRRPLGRWILSNNRLVVLLLTCIISIMRHKEVRKVPPPAALYISNKSPVSFRSCFTHVCSFACVPVWGCCFFAGSLVDGRSTVWRWRSRAAWGGGGLPRHPSTLSLRRQSAGWVGGQASRPSPTTSSGSMGRTSSSRRHSEVQRRHS